MRRSLVLPLLLLCACATPAPAATAGSAPPSRTVAPSPAGLSLEEAAGAVIMVGFRGPLTERVRESWRQHQFGGLLLVNQNVNASDPQDVSALIAALRATARHGLVAATDQEGGTVCFKAGRSPCSMAARQAAGAGPDSIRGEAEAMAGGLRALGFDINFAPVADLWDGVHPVMRDRSYGQDPEAVAAAVSAAVTGTHRAGLKASAKHFPGHGSANADSHVQLPLVSLDAETLRRREWVPFRAAIAAGVDVVMVGHLNVPALDGGAPSSMSTETVRVLRQELGFRGAIAADDLQMQALLPRFPPPAAAVQFLQNGGDVVIVAHDLEVAESVHAAIREAVLSGRLPRARLDGAAQAVQKLQR